MSKNVTKQTKTHLEATSATQLDIDTQIAQLDEAIEWFYGDDFSLTQAVDKYQSAIQIAQTIDQSLSELENQVEVLTQDFTKS